MTETPTAAPALADIPTPDLIAELRRRDPAAVVLAGADYARRLDAAWSAGRSTRDGDDAEDDN